jgi:hypothetical protein
VPPEPTFGNPPPEHPLIHPTEISSNANAPIGTNRRVVRRPNFAAFASANISAVISVSNIANVNIHIGRAELFGVVDGTLDGGTFICANPRAVVVIVIVVLVPAVTDAGLNDALAPVGKPLAVNVTVPGNAPPTVAVAIVKFAELPAVTVCVVVVALTLKSVIVNVNAFDVPPPGVGFTTVIAAVPDEAISAAVIAAVNEVALTNVVTRALPFHCAVDPLMKLVPVSVIVNAAPPAPVSVGEIAVSVGTGFGAVIVNVSAFDVTPDGNPCARAFAPLKTTVGVNTCTEAEPAVAISAAVIAAVNCVELTNVVARLLPFHCATDVLMKLLPFKVSVNAAPPAIAEFGASEVSAGIGVVAVNVTMFDKPPPGVGFTTLTK